MTQAVINNGTFDNDPSAESVRSAFTKVNSNFTELYGRELGVTSISVAAGNVSIPSSVSQANNWIEFTGGLVSRNAVFDPFTGFLWLSNVGSADVVASVGGTDITIAAGAVTYVNGDGTVNGLVSILTLGTGVGTVSSLTAGADIILSPSTITTTGSIAVGTNVARKNAATQWSGAQVNGATPVTLTDGAPTAWDMSLGNTFIWTLSGSHLLSNPTNAVSGGTYVMYINQANHTATFDTNIKLIGSLPATGQALCGVFVNGSNVTIVVAGATGF
jgi:hypothetical protein